MNNAVQIFENNNFGSVRVVKINDEPWFVGKDITEALGYENGSRDIKRHVDKQDVNTAMIPQYRNGTLVTKALVINESGLYSLIMSSKLPQAKTFRRWVTSEILPSVQRHGAYITDDILDKIYNNPEITMKLISRLKKEQEKSEVLYRALDITRPKAEYFDIVLFATNSIPITVIAKDYGMTAVSFNKLLNGLGVQYKVGGTWVLYKKFCNKGYTNTGTIIGYNKRADICTYWTQQGRYFLYKALRSVDILPVAERGAA